MTPEEWELHKKSEAERIKTLRFKKTAASKSEQAIASAITQACLINTPYRTRQSLGKALARVRKELPNSPPNNAAVVVGAYVAMLLYFQLGLHLIGISKIG